MPSGWTPDGQFVLGTYVPPAGTGPAKLASYPAAQLPAPKHSILLEDPTRGSLATRHVAARAVACVRVRAAR